MSESHHKNKKDKPSGTAIKLANDISKNNDKIKNWSINKIEDKKLPIFCERKGNIKGIHEIKYNSNIDTISIKHNAHNREGFAKGAITAAEFIKNKKGIFTMKDIIK